MSPTLRGGGTTVRTRWTTREKTFWRGEEESRWGERLHRVSASIGMNFNDEAWHPHTLLVFLGGACLVDRSWHVPPLLCAVFCLCIRSWWLQGSESSFTAETLMALSR